jgi:hypothetical protein
VQANFKPEPLITEADQANDIRSLRRNTQGFLYLAVKQGSTPNAPWRLPQAPVQGEDDSIRAAAQRAIDATFGDKAESFLFGNMPAGHLKGTGGSTFFMLGIVVDGHPKLQRGQGVQDYAWLTRQEVLQAYEGDADAQQLFSTLMVE